LQAFVEASLRMRHGSSGRGAPTDELPYRIGTGQHNYTAGLAVLVLSCAFAFGCSATKRSQAEAPPPSPTVETTQTPEMSQLPSPELDQVREAVKRVFKESVVIDSNHQPAFLAGDFNGDLSQDIVVVLQPETKRLAELNDEFPTWLLRDVSGDNASSSPRLRVAANEVLLAVIHGYGANGWQDPEATQAFLLKNAAGSGMEVHSATELQKKHHGRKLPRLRGDVLTEVLDGKSGCLYYGNLSYSWYDPRTFTGEPEIRRGHTGIAGVSPAAERR
jgi:hypothetical protein